MKNLGGPRVQEGKPHHNSGAELALRTDEELADELSQSFPGGDRWQGLTYELARRSAEKQERLTKWTFWAAAAALLVGIAGVVATVWR